MTTHKARKVPVRFTIEILTGPALYTIPFVYRVRISYDLMDLIHDTLNMPRTLCGYQDAGRGWIIVSKEAGFLDYWHPATGRVFGEDAYEPVKVWNG